ncbi:MAG: rhodanese-like domain-containing protein [Mailhella sp.]|nr:rhodanese-like domain-containing protein [Mailhella sp.]
MIRSCFRALLSFLLLLCFLSPCSADPLPDRGSLTPEQGMELLAEYAEGGLTILDVRTLGEFRGGHAPNALHIPLSELEDRLSEIPEGPVLIVCRSGRRARLASDILIENGRPAEQLWYLSGYADYGSGKVRFHN